MALIPRSIIDPMEPFDIIDRWDFWDRLRHWRALDYFDSLIPSFFAPLVPSRILSPPSKVIRSKSMTHLQAGQEVVSKDGFEIQLDVIRFRPQEVEVRIIEDCIVVEGKQEEKWDSCKTTTKSFENRYSLPIGYDPWQVSATLSNGLLTIRAPPPTRSLIKCHRRTVPIKYL